MGRERAKVYGHRVCLVQTVVSLVIQVLMIIVRKIQGLSEWEELGQEYIISKIGFLVSTLLLLIVYLVYYPVKHVTPIISLPTPLNQVVV